MKHVDVVIIGGSLAGAACARELARQGIDAVAFDRDRFPREKVCGGFLSPGAIDLLDELEVLNIVREAGATAVRSARIQMGGREISVELPRSGLGVSRRTLDAVMADHSCVQHGFVHNVKRAGERFTVQLEGTEISTKVIVDAAGKLSRFSRRKAVLEFGVQFYETGTRGDVLDFWFFEEAYGGAVTVEGGRTNVCFLMNKDALQAWKAEGRGGVGQESDLFDQHHPVCAGDGAPRLLLERAATPPRLRRGVTCLVTGPLAYDRLSSGFISIGDAAGMVDPFCGEGMRHALDTGLRAAKAVAAGLHRGESYESMRARYEQQSHKRWRGKRRLGNVIRRMLQHPQLMSFGLGLSPEYWFRKLWD